MEIKNPFCNQDPHTFNPDRFINQAKSEFRIFKINFKNAEKVSKNPGKKLCYIINNYAKIFRKSRTQQFHVKNRDIYI